ncbi:MAG: CRISPR-associated protein Cas4 [Zestosphaera sp.]|uniref:CRISPR-associated exonuclease Cas4 n=1 Tax=Metallosphaera cuprina (strain Ar-4) TaxID=1006006 RepID=F4G313_METCR|nr:CRISPR-associated protein Cas4 [Metallosphaera cuprina]AEB95211.1 conserved hypothetical protein [Metallosphaera cuprina Ar-4]
MIDGTSVKNYLFCAAIIRLQELGFRERTTETMIEGRELDKVSLVNFLFGKGVKEAIRKPNLRYKDLVGVPDFVLKFPLHFSVLEIKNTSHVSLSHKAQVVFYAYLMDRLNLRVKDGFLYYVPIKRLIRIPYTEREREWAERLIRGVNQAKRGNLKVIQTPNKCLNCGYFPYCKPRREGKFFKREF